MLVGDSRPALACWRGQAGDCPSPNAGVVMSAGAGALGVRLGGGAYYHGTWEQRPWLGCGAPPADADIQRARGLVMRALVVFVTTLMVLDWLI